MSLTTVASSRSEAMAPVPMILPERVPGSRGGTRLRLAPGTHVLILLAMSAPLVAGPITADAAEINRDINSYVLFAFEELDFKGSNANMVNCVLGVNGGGCIRGNVGVNRVDPNRNMFDLSLGGNDHAVQLQPGGQTVGDNMTLGGGVNSFYGDVFGNFFSQATEDAGKSSGPTPFAAPIIDPANLPTLPAFMPGTQDRIFTANGALPPGDYRDIVVQNGVTLDLSPGVYNVRNLRAGQHVIINAPPGVIFHVKGTFRLNDDTKLLGFGRFLVESVRDDFNDLGANDISINIGRDHSEIHGFFFAPNGAIDLGNDSDLFGQFWARRIVSDFDVNVTLAGTGRILGTKWNDLNGNGVRDEGELPLRGWQIHIFRADLPEELFRVFTDGLGNYTFPDLPPGTYDVCESLEEGWIQTLPVARTGRTARPGPGRSATASSSRPRGRWSATWTSGTGSRHRSR